MSPDDLFASELPPERPRRPQKVRPAGPFALVAVNQPVMQPYHYSIPEKLVEDIAIGSLVIVPFGGRQARGCVLRIESSLDDEIEKKVKPVTRLITHDFVLESELIRLGEWISDYYMAPPGDTLATISFIGFNDIGSHEVTFFHLSPEWMEPVDPPVKLTDKQYAVVEYFRAQENEPQALHDITDATLVGPTVVKRLVEKKVLLESVVEQHRGDDYDSNPASDSPLPLNETQQLAFNEIAARLDARTAETFLIHGVTGSGKTEVYLQIIFRALEQGGEAIVLVPEISLTPQTMNRFRSRFGDIVGVYHSKLTVGQKFDLWKRVQRGQCRIMVGARSAVFTPFSNLRVIIIDEEHETSYKQDSSPRYHARDVAIVRAHSCGAVVVMGSATPSIDSYYKALNGKFRLLSLPERIDERPMPVVRIVDMTREARDNQNPDLFSQSLHAAMEQSLERGEQVLLFLNRRGFFNFVICMDCNTALRCRHCDVTLTHHRPRNALLCHYCGREYILPKKCPECESAELSLLGMGTQRVEERVKEMYPDARVIRMDLDTTRKRTAFMDAWRRIESGDADIILGTQMIAKGFHLEQVTLVGVPLADVSLFQPDFRSAERAFSVLTQVAGRAGRGDKPGQVIIQTYVPHHYAIGFAQTHDYRGFFDKEIRVRQVLRFPPHFRLVSLLVAGKDDEKTSGFIKELGRHLRNRSYQVQGEVTVLGPVPAPIARIKDEFRWRMLLRGRDHRDLRVTVKEAQEFHSSWPGKSKVRLVVDVDPLDLM